MPRGTPTLMRVPTQGVRRDVVAPDIPDGALYQSSNVLPRYGQMTFRPGLQRVIATGPGGRISGGIAFRTALGADKVVAANLTDWFTISGSVWQKLTGTAWTGSANDPIRFAVFPSSGINYVFGVNNQDTPAFWDGVSSSRQVLSAAPVGRDITVSANHLIIGNVVESGVRSKSRIRLSAFNDPFTWPGNLTVDLTDTNDDIVALRALGRTQFTTFKDQSLWVGIAQAGTFPFRFEEVEPRRPGPCSPAAIVQDGNSHYYLGTDKRVYQFDGITNQPVSDPIEKDIQADFNSVNRGRVFGFNNDDDRSIWFCYPSAQSSDPDRAVSYNLRTQVWHEHTFPVKMSAGWFGFDVAALQWKDLTGTWLAIGPGTYPTWLSFGGTLSTASFLGSATGQVYLHRFGIPDDGAPISAFWEIPPRFIQGLDVQQAIDAIESNFQQQAEGDPVDVYFTTSAANAEDIFPKTFVGRHDTTLATRQLMDFNKIFPRGVMKGDRMVGLRFEVTSDAPLNYRGTLLWLYKEQVP